MPQIAKETNGGMFATEHRYYGKSLPNIPNHKLTEYYKYLSSFLALQDVAILIKMLKSDPKFMASKVVVIGGSYAGNLAAWMRVLYPNLVDAALAASAPVLAKKDCPEFLEAVRDTFAKYGTKNCINHIANRFKEYEDLLKSPQGIEILKRKLNINSDLTILENQQKLFTRLYEELADTAQSGPPSDVVKKCHQYQYGHNRKLRDTPISWRDYSNIEFNPWTDDDSWYYQACNEFGYQMTTSAEKQPFVHWSPLNYTLKSCKRYIDGDIERRMDQGVFLTNQMYGGLTPNVTKVVFTHGDMDPWRSLGIKQSLGPEAPAITIEGTAHCGIILQEMDGEPIKMKLARVYVKNLIKKWISE
ncbi:thymus-specific serine protease-like [Cydia splendana]|uniref:thymus-specific serine protease-like n=1 Tax=Cydia splendana TaxID=1100963 RepID=UPI00300C5011